MGSKQQTVDFILAQIADAGVVSARKMFGEYAVYCSGQMVGLICDDQLFIKITPAGCAHFDTIINGTPYPGAKPHLLVPGDRLEDAEWLTELVRASARALPELVSRRHRGRN